MPGFDRTGPLGRGPMTGRGLGPCGRGVAFRRGLGLRTCRLWYTREQFQPKAYPQHAKEQETEDLKAEKGLMERELKAIEERIKGLEGNK